MAEIWKGPELQESGLSESQTKLTSENASTHEKGQSNVHERTPTECSRSDYPPSQDQEGTEWQNRSKESTPEISEKNGVDQTPEYPSSWKLTMIMTGLCLSIFCMALDNTIMATAIPKITDQFNSLSDVGWYGSSYLLTVCSLTLMFGKFYTFFSTKWIFLTGLTIFEIGSFICGIAPNSVALIIGRAVAGCGAAGLFSGAMLIVYRTVPLQKRPIYSGLLGGIFGVASVAGPLMGGAFTDHLSWRWCFYINLPFGAVTWLFIFFFFKAPRSIKETTGIKDQISQLDLPGTLFFMPAIICMLLALQWGGTKYAWNSARIIALFVLFGVLIAGFIALQWYGQDKATVPPRIIKNRNVWGAGFFNFCLGASFLVFCYFLPIWFQAIKGVTATESGIMNLPLILGCVIFSFISGTFVSVLGYYTPFLLMSPAVMAIGGGLLSTLKVDSGHAAWIGYQALLGIGLGVGMQQPMMVVQTALPAADVPSATAIVMFTQTLGGALFVSVGENVFQNQLYKNLAIDAPNINSTELVSAGATMLRRVVSEGDLPAVLHAYNAAVTQAFYVPIAIGALAILGALPVQWISVKGKNVEMLAG